VPEWGESCQARGVADKFVTAATHDLGHTACNPVSNGWCSMVPIVSVVGCVLIAVGLWGSVLSLKRDGAGKRHYY